jgi:hypothetical protein
LDRHELDRLSLRLDEDAWGREEDAGRKTVESLAAFRAARAFAAMSAALHDDPRNAAADAVYEAYFALGEDQAFLDGVASELAEGRAQS